MLIYIRCMSRILASQRLLILGFLSMASGASAQSQSSVAVLALNSHTADPTTTWISRGMADMLTTDLAKVGKLTVVQREQLDKVLKEQALGASGAVDSAKAVEFGKILSAQTLLTGSYVAVGPRLRVDLQLINSSTGRVEGGVTAEGSIDSIFSLEKQLVLAVLSKLGVTPTASEMQALMQSETFNNQALALNYQGLVQLQTDPKSAVATLQKAVELDPNYASAQRNLRTALSLSGFSIANAAKVDLEIKKKEIQVVREVAELLKSSLRLSDVKFESPTTEAGKPGYVSVGYSGKISLPPGTTATIAKMLEPYSREGSDRRAFAFHLPGVVRGDTKKIYLSKDSIDFLVDYLNGFTVVSAFYSRGPQPVYIKNSGFAAQLILSGNAEYYELRDISLPRGGLLDSVPISMLSNLTNSGLIIVKQESRDRQEVQTAGFKGFEFMKIPVEDADELGIPEGYIKSQYCGVKWGGDYTSTWSPDIRVSKIFEVYNTGYGYGNQENCQVFTKIDNLPFSEALLRDRLESGNSFEVTYYDLKTKKLTTRSHISSPFVNLEYDNYGIEFLYKVSIIPNLNSNSSFYYRIESLKFDDKKTIGFRINRMF